MKRAQGKQADRGAFGAGGFGGFGALDAGSSLSYLAEPPSFNAVSDPNVVVSLKNVLKKDSTTKAKGLEDLMAYVQAHPHEKDGGVEEAILEVWVQVYPRTSIDNSRRVRELSHNLQLELLKSARKRMERYIPKVVGAWLAGLYDRDRVVARAASDGLTPFLNTPEKVLVFWRKCQDQILDYAVSAIQETEDTLSDERSTTKEDAEAKYFRVIISSLSLVLGLLQKVEDADIEKSRSRYDDFFAEDTVWKSITFSDSSVRKTTCQLLFAVLNRNLPYAESTKVKQAFVTGGLKTNQSGSALEYVRALTKMTQNHPDIWVSSGSSSEKKSSLSRLQSFISKGSQGSPPKFWECLDQLLTAVPAEALTAGVSSKLLTALKSGITNRDEPRTNTSFSWKCYSDTAQRLLKGLAAEDQLPFVQEHFFPLIEQFLFSVSDKPAAVPLGPNAMSIFVEIYIATVQSAPPVVSASVEEWDRLASVFCAKISGSLPEVSKEYQSSQEKIAEEGRRWFGIVGHVQGKIAELDNGIPDHVVTPSNKVISQSITLLESRNLKPFGATRILEFALSTAPRLFSDDSAKRMHQFLLSIAQNDVNKAFESSSFRHLLSCIQLFGAIPGQENTFKEIWKTWIQAALSLESSLPRRDTGIASLISGNSVSELARQDAKLQQYLHDQALAAAKAEAPTAWEPFQAAVTYRCYNDETCHAIAGQLVELLGDEPHIASTLRALEVLGKGKPELLSPESDIHTALVAQLLSLTEINNPEISGRVVAMRSLLDSQSDGKLPVIAIIQSNLETAGAQSLDIETLVHQAKAAADTEVPAEDLFPSTVAWMKELTPFFDLPVNPAISITNNLAGAAFLVDGSTERPELRVPRDRKGRAIPIRMALYTNQLLSAGLDHSKLPGPFLLEILYLQYITVQLVSDQITSLESNSLWKTLGQTEFINQAEEFVSSTRAFVNSLVSSAKGWAEDSSDATSAVIRDLVDLMIQQSKDLGPRGFYSARSLSELIQSLAEAHGVSSQVEERLLTPELLKISPSTVLPASAIIIGLGETLQTSKSMSNFCNKVVSEVAGATIQGEKTKLVLVLLSACVQVYETGELPVANNRIVFAVRQLTSWMDTPEDIGPSLSAEVCRSLTRLLPCMNEVYGSYWEKTIEFCIYLWKHAGDVQLDQALPFIYSSLKLVKTIEAIQEPNDDLQDAIKEHTDSKYKTLIGLLSLDREMSSQALDIVDAMLCREVEKISIRHIPELSEIFGLIGSDSREIQTAAFNLLHHAIPAQQEQNSIDVLLDKTDARLPDELLSLLSDAPTLEKYSDEALSQFPSSIRTYLLSWKLVFDAYSTSSFKIRNDFTENLKTEKMLESLLEFTFDILGHSAAHPLKLEKVNLTTDNIKNYDVKLAESAPKEKSMQWLLVHLYYFTLKYIPGLFRSWYIECRSKQTRIAVESWTTKYFSPLIISDALDEVQSWADTQEPPAMDEQELLVKVARAAGEITAGYEVDEDSAAIVIKIPASYPIESVSVNGLHRVAVSEKKWQSWIMTTQGVITFSNGNIIDGLQVFKRNIVGALKGQSECAICYSIISTDKRMPDKRCTTCKNLFHRTCLYKWFQSSNQNTCPLCRNPIDYLGADTAKRRQ